MLEHVLSQCCLLVLQCLSQKSCLLQYPFEAVNSMALAWSAGLIRR